MLILVALLLCGCPGPADRERIERIDSFEQQLDVIMQSFEKDPALFDQLTDRMDLKDQESSWTFDNLFYHVWPLEQPAGAWVAYLKIHAQTKSDTNPGELWLHLDFIHRQKQWDLYLAMYALPGAAGKDLDWQIIRKDDPLYPQIEKYLSFLTDIPL
jgi:hypothetical protein